jgi:Tfp pilus assembly protein PilF
MRRWLAIGLALVLLSCGSKPAKSGAQSASAQSVAQYDIATDLWLKRGQPRKALEHALEALSLDDENAQAAHLIALLYLDFCNRDPEECRLDEAERHARLAVSLQDDFREAKNTLGVVLIHLKRYDEAIAVLKPLTQDLLYATPENAWGNLGWAELEKGNLGAAIEALLRSTAVQPKFCVGHYRLGLAYERKGDPNAAMEAFTRALDVDHPLCRQMQVAFLHRAKTAVQLGRQDDASRDLQECVQLDKSTPTGRECSALLAKLH